MVKKLGFVFWMFVFLKKIYLYYNEFQFTCGKEKLFSLQTRYSAKKWNVFKIVYSVL